MDMMKTIAKEKGGFKIPAPAPSFLLKMFLGEMSEELLKRNQLTGSDIAYLVPHQANKRIIDATASRIGLSEDKVMVNIQRYGNTTAGTIPLCLFDWEDKLKKGDLLVFAAFGGGFTWGASLVKWGF